MSNNRKGTNWRQVAEMLADRMECHAYCDSHSRVNAVENCPHCGDRSAYDRYLALGGRDFRAVPDPRARHIPLSELVAGRE